MQSPPGEEGRRLRTARSISYGSVAITVVSAVELLEGDGWLVVIIVEKEVDKCDIGFGGDEAIGLIGILPFLIEAHEIVDGRLPVLDHEPEFEEEEVGARRVLPTEREQLTLDALAIDEWLWVGVRGVGVGAVVDLIKEKHVRLIDHLVRTAIFADVEPGDEVLDAVEVPLEQIVAQHDRSSFRAMPSKLGMMGLEGAKKTFGVAI